MNGNFIFLYLGQELHGHVLEKKEESYLNNPNSTLNQWTAYRIHLEHKLLVSES